ncbi:MAG: tetratricopeptide repeat protein, partial [Opitutales bacterium]
KRDTIIKLSERYEGKYSGNLLRLLDQCLAVDEEERPQSVDECFNALKKQSALKSIQSEDSVQAIKVPKVPKLGGEIKSNKKNIWAKGLLISIIFLIIMGVVYALYPIKDYDALHQEAKIAYDSKDYARAIELSVEAVRKDYAWAQNLLALCYYRGNGVTQNYTEALRWWKKSAEQGYAFAQCSLGDCYERGNGVTQNYTEAVKWYRKSAEQGNAYAEQALKRLGD